MFGKFNRLKRNCNSVVLGINLYNQVYYFIILTSHGKLFDRAGKNKNCEDVYVSRSLGSKTSFELFSKMYFKKILPN